jgi:hypothetical protein
MSYLILYLRINYKVRNRIKRNVPIANGKTVIKVVLVVPIKMVETDGSAVPKLDLRRQIPMAND